MKILLNNNTVVIKSALAFFFLFFLHGISIGNGQQGISYNGTQIKTVPMKEKIKELFKEYYNDKTMPVVELEEKVLALFDVVGRSEQLKCGNSNPPCSPNIKFGYLECTECNWSE